MISEEQPTNLIFNNKIDKLTELCNSLPNEQINSSSPIQFNGFGFTPPQSFRTPELNEECLLTSEQQRSLSQHIQQKLNIINNSNHQTPAINVINELGIYRQIELGIIPPPKNFQTNDYQKEILQKQAINQFNSMNNFSNQPINALMQDENFLDDDQIDSSNYSRMWKKEGSQKESLVA